MRSTPAPTLTFAACPIFTLFYVLASSSLAARVFAERAPRALRVGGRVTTVLLGAMFIETYVGLLGRSPWFAIPAVLIGLGVAYDMLGTLPARVLRQWTCCRSC